MQKHTVLSGKWLWVVRGQDGKSMVDIQISYFKALKPAHHIILAKALEVIGAAEKPMPPLM